MQIFRITPATLDLRVKFYLLRICLDLLLEVTRHTGTQPASRPPQALDLLAVPQYYSTRLVVAQWRGGLDVLLSFFEFISEGPKRATSNATDQPPFAFRGFSDLSNEQPVPVEAVETSSYCHQQCY